MSRPDIIWIASYPRCGNTLMRTILWHCFGLRSASVYPNDLGGKKELENYVGHIEQSQGRQIQFPSNGLPLVKTHEYPIDSNPAIYIVRDGRAASVSLWNFYNKKITLESIIYGRHRFGTWSNHLKTWKPWSRTKTLCIKYEDMVRDLSPVLEATAFFLDRKALTDKIPARKIIAASDGRWVKTNTDWRAIISSSDLQLCNEINKEMLEKFGYLD